jgi:vitamin B12 transporter
MVTGYDLLRRPQSTSTVGFSTSAKARNSLSFTAIYNGDRWDYDYTSPPAQRVKLSDYIILNLSLNHLVNESSSCFLRFENLLNEDYEEVYGYEAPGFSVYGGANFSF